MHQQNAFTFPSAPDLNFLSQLSPNEAQFFQQSFQFVQKSCLSDWTSNSDSRSSFPTTKDKISHAQFSAYPKTLTNHNTNPQEEEEDEDAERDDHFDGDGVQEGEEKCGPLSPVSAAEGAADSSCSNRDSKRRRTSFTSKQLLELEREFITKKYLSLGERAELARTLRLSQEQIKVWFQNRRAKWKRSKGYRGGGGGPPNATDQEGGAGSGNGAARTISSSFSSSNSTTTTGSAAGCSTHKIYVPIPVHVDRVRLRSQQQQIEKR